MEIVIQLLQIVAIIFVAFVMGKIVSKLKLPAILGWLIAGVVFGPYLAGIVSQDTIDSNWYKIVIKFFECFAGVMIGKEIIFKKIAKSGKQIIGITFVQSIWTFLVVSLFFSIIFAITNVPIYLAFIFGGIALATAPAPALSIVNEYKTNGPVTQTLIPLAAIDDVIGVIVFFSVISVINGLKGTNESSIFMVLGIVSIPFIIGIILGFISSLIIKIIKNKYICFSSLIIFLIFSTILGLVIDINIFHSFQLNYLLIGMAFSGTVANLVNEEKFKKIEIMYSPLLSLSLVIVIVNLGMPLDYTLIAGAGLLTFVYIVSRAMGKISGAYLGGKMTKADDKVTKYLGLTLLPHSGVSLVFAGIAATTLAGIDSSLAAIVSGTICAAAIINEIFAVIIAKYAFKLAGELGEN